MRGNNMCIISGAITHSISDAKIYQYGNNKRVMNINLKIDTKRESVNDKKIFTYADIAIWDEKLINRIQGELNEGDFITVVGYLNSNTYVDDYTNKERYSLNVSADAIYFDKHYINYLNVVNLVGYAGMQYYHVTQSGTKLVNFSVIVNDFDNNSGKSDFFKVTAYGLDAEYIAEKVKRGDLVNIKGVLNSGSYIDEDGEKINTTNILASSVDLAIDKSKEDEMNNKWKNVEYNEHYLPNNTVNNNPYTNPNMINNEYLEYEQDYHDDYYEDRGHEVDPGVVIADELINGFRDDSYEQSLPDGYYDNMINDFVDFDEEYDDFYN